MVNLGGALSTQFPYGGRGPCCFEASAAGRPCECLSQKRPGKNPYNLNSLQAWNCGQRCEPEFLEDHVKCYHPRPANPSLAPKITFGHTTKVGQPVYPGGYCEGGAFGTGRGPPRSKGSSYRPNKAKM